MNTSRRPGWAPRGPQAPHLQRRNEWGAASNISAPGSYAEISGVQRSWLGNPGFSWRSKVGMGKSSINRWFSGDFFHVCLPETVLWSSGFLVVWTKQAKCGWRIWPADLNHISISILVGLVWVYMHMYIICIFYVYIVYIVYIYIYFIYLYIYIWVNSNVSLTWIVGPFWDDFPIKTMIPGLGRTTWGRD